jgi:8-oxo-dGTP diphosphatase
MTLVRAAGGVAVRAGASGDEVLVVYRRSYGDWTFPKGKADPGESDEACAVREVEEETGLRCSLEAELPSTRYHDRLDRPKLVRYWRLAVVAGELQAREGEIDDARWVQPAEARALLTYPHDLAVLDAAVGT